MSPSGEIAAGRHGGRPVSQDPLRLGTLARAGLPAAAGFGLPFLLVLYLALKGGGYDTVIRSEVGVAIWWVVLLGALIGVLPATRVTRAGWIGVGVLAAFVVWTTLGLTWTDSSERTMAEVGKVAAYLGVFALALLAQGREGLRRTVGGVTAAIGVVCVLALLSRLHPQWFPANDTAAFLPGTRARLSYPLNYWNGLAAFAAIGIPLLLGLAASARRLVTRSVAAAALPAVSLTAFFTLSRGGAVEIGVGLLVLLALHPRRLSLVPTALVAGGGSAILIAAANQRDALTDGLGSATAHSQGNEMLAMVLVVCAGVALLQAALGLASQAGMIGGTQPSRRATLIGWVGGIAAAAIIAIAAGVPGWASDRWDEFKQPSGAGSNTVSRFESSSGNGRYQYWQSAADANATDPLTGIGPGTYEYWWAQEGSLPGFVRDAHSLYMETLGETGVIGLVLIAGLLLLVLGTGAVRSLGEGSPERRALVAAATAGCAAFATAAALDWVWEIAVIPVALLLLAAAILSPDAEARARSVSRFEGGIRRPARAVVAAVALGAIVVIAIPMAGVAAVRESQSAVRHSQLSTALDRAQTAASIQPYAATPRLQEAMILELDGNFDAAARAAGQAADNEPTNWRNWLILSRIEAERGNAHASVAAFRQARSLNPRSVLFE